MSRKIKVLVVDDSQLFRTAISRGLTAADPDLDIVATASDPYDARDKILQFHPDVMTLDCEMPHMNGLEFLKRLMPQYPMPVIVVSAVNGIVFDAMNAGAVDFVAKPEGGNLDAFVKDLASKLKIASMAKLTRGASSRGTAVIQTRMAAPPRPAAGGITFNGTIYVGASTGGTEATALFLKGLPADIPGMVVVQHMPPVFTRMYAERLDTTCAMRVREAKDGDRIEKGLVLIAPGGYQCKVVNRAGSLSVNIFEGQKVSGHSPSVDVLFNSAAEACKKNAIGIILTGMGSDGASGLLEMRKKGAHTIGQDEKSCVVYGMPMVAYNIGAVEKQVAIGDMATVLLAYMRSRS